MNKSVVVDYTLKLKGSESILDTSIGKNPIKFNTGEGLVIRGFEDAVLSLEPGDSGTFEIKPNDAYGEYNNDMVITVDKSRVPEGLQIGSELRGVDETGSEFSVFVKEILEDSVVVDGNHPLAGKDLIYDITLIESTEI